MTLKLALGLTLICLFALPPQAWAQNIGDEAAILVNEPAPPAKPPTTAAPAAPEDQGSTSEPTADASPADHADAAHQDSKSASDPTAPTSGGDATSTSTRPRLQTVFIDAMPVNPADSKVFDESGLTSDKKRGRFTIPLLFAPEDNGFELGRPQIKWDIFKGKEVILSGLRIKASDIGFVISQIPRKESGGFLPFFKSHPSSPLMTSLSFRWPQIFATTGTMTLEDEAGQAVWTQEITAAARSKWRDFLKSKPAAKNRDIQVHAASQWGLADLDPKDYPFLFKRLALRACFSKNADQDQKLRICSGLFYLTPGPGDHVSYSEASLGQASARLENKDVGDHGLINFPDNKKITFGVRFASGAEFNVTSQPIHLHIYDAVESPSGRTVLLTGEGAQPVGHVKMLKIPEVHFWSGTIVKQERIWQLAIPKEAPVVKVLGAFNMPFDLLFDAKRLPKEADRAYIADRQTQTYARLPSLYGTTASDINVKSDEFTVHRKDAEPFEWEFLANHVGQDNRARIKLSEKDGTPWIAHYDLYRAYPSEVGAHFTGVLAADNSATLIGEVTVFHWMEDLGFTDNKTLALQRWGLDFRYFRVLSSFKLGDGTNVSAFDQYTGNLRYNLTRGIWNRDEIFGVMLSGEHIHFATLGATLFGPGAYWGRTMPKLADDALNLIPFLRYPKYLEIELAYVPFSTVSTAKAGSTYNLNFRGKVFFKTNFFGEAGFGIKQIQFTDTTQQAQASFTTAFGLVGLGLLF